MTTDSHLNPIILASNNPGKISELGALLKPLICVPQADLNIPDVEEHGLTFVENALIKARHAALLGNAAALADDSGLVVDALHGEPGIYSARFAKMYQSPLNNVDYLLSCLAEVPFSARSAYFYCAIVLLQHANDPTPLIVTGKWEGYIAFEPQGHQGFGYDPVFYLPALKCTAAVLDPEQKNQLSHRGQAMKALKAALSCN